MQLIDSSPILRFYILEAEADNKQSQKQMQNRNKCKIANMKVTLSYCNRGFDVSNKVSKDFLKKQLDLKSK